MRISSMFSVGLFVHVTPLCVLDTHRNGILAAVQASTVPCGVWGSMETHAGSSA